MKYRRVGKSGLKVSEISLGSWLTYGGTVENEIAKKCMATAIDNGINFIDSAEIYAKGEAEKVIAEFLADGTYDRKDLVISSKVFWPMNENINRWGLSRKNIMTSLSTSVDPSRRIRYTFSYLSISYTTTMFHKVMLR